MVTLGTVKETTKGTIQGSLPDQPLPRKPA